MKAVLVTVPATAGGIVLVAGGKSSGPGYPASATISVPANGQIVFVGGQDVDVTNGFPVAAGGVLQLDLVNESLYGIVASGTQVVNVLRRYD